MRDVDRRIAVLAARQQGVVTRAQLLEAGLRPGAVDRRLKAGQLRRLHRGVYLVGPLMPVRAREMAAVLASGPGAVLSHASAAALWELLPARGDTVRVDVTVPAGDRGRRPGITVHRVVALEADERAEVSGIPITTPARTVVDLAGVLGTREVERAVARGERTGLLNLEALPSLLSRYRGRPGMPALRALLGDERTPALTRSEAEEKFLALIRRARLPAPEANVVVEGHEVDFLWRSEGIAVEVDGFRFHASRSMFERDRRRDARLAARGINVIRLTWRQIIEEGIATAVQVGQSLVQGRRP
ncbi:MAG: type IV toxin-antitoxin system AbiEi family antitoxin domain-containing protein [Gemmatimonadetes bacterium]|nr:type IV toxin-antitoxin system AbiEi family antitoxin domain-containing protein [Gemmatimonadota bacterium]